MFHATQQEMAPLNTFIHAFIDFYFYLNMIILACMDRIQFSIFYVDTDFIWFETENI